MNLKSSILLAFRMILPKASSTSNARKSILGAVMCIALSLVPLVVVLVMADGMIEGITNRIVGLSSYHLQAIQYPSFTDSDDTEVLDRFLETIRITDGVKSAYPERQGIALAAGKKGRTGATIRAVDPDVFVKDTSFKKYVKVHSGKADLSNSKNVLVGKAMAQNLGVEVGDKLRIITARKSPNGKMIPKISIFNITGIISCGYQEIDALWIFIPFKTGYTLMSNEASQVIIGIETYDAFSPELHATRDRIARLMPNEFELYKWSDMNSSEFENFSSTKLLLLLVMFLIVLVATVNVSSALVMLVMERRREIAILKSIGASNGGITSSFILIGTCIGASGVLIGVPLGLLAAINVNSIISFLEKILNFFTQLFYQIVAKEGFSKIQLLDPAYYLEEIPVVIPFAELFIISAVTLLLSVLVSVIPSIRAGKEKPLSILRKV